VKGERYSTVMTARGGKTRRKSREMQQKEMEEEMKEKEK